MAAVSIVLICFSKTGKRSQNRYELPSHIASGNLSHILYLKSLNSFLFSHFLGRQVLAWEKPFQNKERRGASGSQEGVGISDSAEQGGGGEHPHPQGPCNLMMSVSYPVTSMELFVLGRFCDPTRRLLSVSPKFMCCKLNIKVYMSKASQVGLWEGIGLDEVMRVGSPSCPLWSYKRRHLLSLATLHPLSCCDVTRGPLPDASSVLLDFPAPEL